MLDAVFDVSHHNGTSLDFQAAAAGGSLGAIQKATQGTNWTDPTWAPNRTSIVNAGLMFGSYHFGDGSDGGAQANYFLQVVGPTAGQLLCLDFEQNPAGPSMTIEEARAFVTTVQSSVGKWPLLYSGHYLKDALGGINDSILSNCPLWLAQYGPTAVLPPGWNNWSFWQYTDGNVGAPAPVPGIGQCDRNRFDGDAPALTAFWATVSP
jgi:lysozyme